MIHLFCYPFALFLSSNVLQRFSQFLCPPNINDMIPKNKSIFFFKFLNFVCAREHLRTTNTDLIFFFPSFLIKNKIKQKKKKDRPNPRLIEKIHAVLSQVLKYILPERQTSQILRLWQYIKFNSKLNFAGNGNRVSKKKIFFPKQFRNNS